MKVDRVTCVDFMCRGFAQLELPTNGVVVIVGDNGAGKSRFIEAVSYAWWGKSLRGKPPWIDGVAGSVEVAAAGHTARRVATAAGNARLFFNGTKADTNTKTQELIDSVVGDQELWRRTHVFSSADALHFSDATDAGRKDLIESLLGLTVFDRGLEKCKQDTDLAVDAVVQAKIAFDRIGYELTSKRVVLDHWSDLPPFEEEPPPVWTGSDAPLHTVNQINGYIAELQTRLNALVVPTRNATLDDDYGNALHTTAAAKRHLELARVGKCTTCEQAYVRSVDQAELQYKHAVDREVRLRQDLQRAAQTLKTEQDLHRQNSAGLLQSIADWRAQITLSNEYETQRVQHARVVAQFEARQQERRARYAQQLAENQARKQRLVKEIQQVQADLAAAKSAHQAAQQNADELAKAAVVIKAIRGRVLSTTLDGISAVANTWLAQIAQPDVMLQLRGYTETQAGKLVDKISLEVQGYGGGYGYKALSGGQRRRVDAALLFALAEVGAASTGSQGGTLWMDEVFDALDAGGLANVAAALAELGKTRCVVVITHLPTLALSIPAVARYTIVDGSIMKGIK